MEQLIAQSRQATATATATATTATTVAALVESDSESHEEEEEGSADAAPATPAASTEEEGDEDEAHTVQLAADTLGLAAPDAQETAAVPRGRGVGRGGVRSSQAAANLIPAGKSFVLSHLTRMRVLVTASTDRVPIDTDIQILEFIGGAL